MDNPAPSPNAEVDGEGEGGPPPSPPPPPVSETEAAPNEGEETPESSHTGTGGFLSDEESSGEEGPSEEDAPKKHSIPVPGGPTMKPHNPIRHSMDNKRRRSSLLGNLLAQGRLSRGLSIMRIAHHMTMAQRKQFAGETEAGNPPVTEDYYFLHEDDPDKIYLERSEKLPGHIPPTLMTIHDLVKQAESQPEDLSPPPSPPPPMPSIMEPDDIPPPSAIFPVERNTVEMQSKLAVIRNLRMYQQHNQVPEGQCYYADEDAELAFLKAKPPTFIILGKPGIGKTTLAMKLAEKMHSIHLTPENIIEYFRGPEEPLNTLKVNDILESGGTVSDSSVIELIEKRLKELDVLHRGYVLDGYPLVTSDDLPLDIQIEALEKLAMPPEYLIILQMQDKDLYKRRVEQKYDSVTNKVYVKQQYSNFDPDWMIFNRAKYVPSTAEKSLSKMRETFGSFSDNPVTEEASDTDRQTSFGQDDARTATPEEVLNVNEIDFPKMSHDVLDRLFVRTEDFNIIVNDDLESFRYNFNELQYFVQNFDKRKAVEIDGYWSPTIIFRRVWEFCEAVGLQPIPLPAPVIKSATPYEKKSGSENRDLEGAEQDDEDDEDNEDDEDDEDDDDEAASDTLGGDTTDFLCEDDAQTEVDWVSAMRTVCVRNLVDPRFRWSISRWDTLCPVMLKWGRTTPGKPELAVSFMDKVYFLSSKQAAEQFIVNPRPYLLPKMPTSPVKFIVIGHPLAGKTTFSKEMAALTDSAVIDMTREINKRFNSVKRDYMWKKRLKYVLESSNMVNRENELRWQRQERTRRRDMHAWIENHLKAIAEAEIVAMLERDKEMLSKIRSELRKQSEYHAIGEVYMGDGSCNNEEGKPVFNWKKFVKQAMAGKKAWSHQELLELAWDLFHQRRLYYKWKRRQLRKASGDYSSSETDEDGDLDSQNRSASDSERGGSGEEEDEEEEEDIESMLDSEGETQESLDLKKSKKKKKKKKKKCVKTIEVKPVKSEDIVEPFIFESFDVDPDNREPEESIRLRFPEIPFELVDLVPQPSILGETDPVVQAIVDEKLSKDEFTVDTMPAEIFVEILRRAIHEVETAHKKKNNHTSVTGGWIIDNFPPDIEKWRAVLRFPQICPDQVFVLVDLTDGNMTIWGRFKKLYKMLHPPAPPPVPEDAVDARSGSVQSANSRLDPIPGEGGSGTKVILEARGSDYERMIDGPEFLGEAGESFYTIPNLSRKSSSKRSSGRASAARLTNPETTTFGTGDETDSRKHKLSPELDPHSLDIVTKSHFILSLLPRDNLLEQADMSSSEEALIKIDLRRIQTEAFSGSSSFQDLQQNIQDGLLNINLEERAGEAEEYEEPCLDLDLDEAERREKKYLPLKPIYGEMSACMEEPSRASQDKKRSLSLTSGSEKKLGLINPPGTPEAGDFFWENEDRKSKEWVEPEPVVHPEEYKGEEDVGEGDGETLHDGELKSDVGEIKRNSEEYIKTPTEMGSYSAILPGASFSRDQSILASPIVQKLLTTKIESPKRKFFTQVRMFNEFWNMALPVSNQEGVKYWEVGLCDENTAPKKALFFWNELESRFDPKARKLLETEVKEEDDEILESYMKWGDPFDVGDSRHRSQKDKRFNDDDDDDSEIDSEEENETDDEETVMDSKPETYLRANLRREAERCFGDFKTYCPVTYHDLNLLRKGFHKFACKYKNRLYFCADEDSQLRFLTNPKQFISKAGPPKPTPPRICITGSPGCLQEEIASQLCTSFKVCYVNFRQRMHEIIKARFGRNLGPEWTNEIVSKSVTDNALETIKKSDDLILDGSEFRGEGEEEDEEEDEEIMTRLKIVGPTPSKQVQKIPSAYVQSANEKKRSAIDDITLKSLGLMSHHNIETVPLNSIERTEVLTERKWQKLTWTEAYIKAFLENGVQLPDEVLDEFILPLWKAKPFTDVGFILVGFPNTQEDIHYMVKRLCIPEYVFVMECKSVVVRNRLIVPAVDRWHKEKNPSGKKYRRLTARSLRAKAALEEKRREHTLGYQKKPMGKANEIFPYQSEGRKEVNEFERETWSYNDELSRDIARGLRYYHRIYSQGLDRMKRLLNKEKISWMPVDTNTGIHQGKHKVLDSATIMLKYRSNIFEDTVRLSHQSAQALLEKGVFTLSPLLRWCPVELSKGNTGINVWHAPGVKKIPYLYRKHIYFIGGEKNAKHFEENTWELANQALPLQGTPMYCLVLGKAKTGKTSLAKTIANRLGLLYTSCLEAVEHVLAHTFVTEWATVLREFNPSLAASGHQPMHLANELLEYIRQGRAIPRFLVYRCLDLFLMQPKAQCNGIVFDDFPTIIDELIELNYREISPCIVLNMKIPITEAYARCDRMRAHAAKNNMIPEEGHDCIDHLWDQYGHVTSETLNWFMDEYQNVHKIDGTQNPEVVYKEGADLCISTQRKIQEYLTNLYYGRPNTLDGTCPLTSTLFHRLNPEYGFYCPVSLNDNDELVSGHSVSELNQVVEYKGLIYLFVSKNAAQKFVRNPRRYTAPGCHKLPPKDLPQLLTITADDFERLNEHWGFMDFDPVLYYANHHYKGLQRGDPKYCVVYMKKLYVFINEDNQKKFMRTPTKYYNLLLPIKIPRKAQPINYDKITPYSYLSSKGMIGVLKKVVKLMAEKRPRAPFMRVDQCAALYMGYYLKSQNMDSPFEVRQKYRDAMFKMMTIKNSTKEMLNELQNFYGCRPRNLPERIRRQLDEFIQFEQLPIEEKIYMPRIPGEVLGYDNLKQPFTETQVARKVRRMMERLHEIEMKDKMAAAYEVYSKQKDAIDEARKRASEDARRTSEMAQKREELAMIRMSKVKSHSRSLISNSSAEMRNRVEN